MTEVIYTIDGSDIAFLNYEDLTAFIEIANNSNDYENVFPEDIRVWTVWKNKKEK